jgi:hypothetical protein
LVPHRRTRDRSTTNGQGLVEFALILPIVVLVLLLAIDFGRVFYGWVGLQNGARIAANYAAQHPDGWQGAGDPTTQADYASRLADDMEGVCGATYGDALAWSDDDADGDYEVGEYVTAETTCEFPLITPLVEGIFGGPVPLRASATFTVRVGQFDGPTGVVPPPPQPTCRTVPTLIDQTIADAQTRWTNSGFTGAFTTNPAGARPTDKVTGQATSPSSSPGDCIAPSATVLVAWETPVGCTGSEIALPDLRTLTYEAARTAWSDAGFTGSFAPANGQNNSIVQSQTTNPAGVPGDCRVPETTVTVSNTPPATPPPAPCDVPNFIGSWSTNAQDTWSMAGFTTSVSFKKPGQRPYVIGEQSIPYPSTQACATTTIQVGP